MKGDFSRLTFDRKKHYSGVLLQQGRVLVDADWNEQQRISRYRSETEAADVIGPAGVPAAGGLELRTGTQARSLAVVQTADADALLAWIVGDKGLIQHWDGATLKQQTPPAGVTRTLRSVYFADEKTGWAAGDRGVILHTADGGATWTKQASKTTNHLLSIAFLKWGKTFAGCAAGVKGTLLFSADGGKTWMKQSPPAAVQLNAVCLIPGDKGKRLKIIAVGNRRTIWEYHWEPGNRKLSEAAVEIDADTTARPNLYAVNAVCSGDVEQACAAGAGGALYVKTGCSWSARPSGVAAPLRAVAVVRLPGEAGDSGGYLWAAVCETGALAFTETAGLEHWFVFPAKIAAKVRAVCPMNCFSEQAPRTLAMLDDQGAIYRQTADGWSRFGRLISELTASAGRLYIGGVLCEFEEATPLPLPGKSGKYLAYAECRHRHITAHQDPHIRETALGGPDTCTRLQTIAEIKYLPLQSGAALEKVEELRQTAQRIAREIRGSLAAKSAADRDSAAADRMIALSALTEDEMRLSGGAAGIRLFAEKQKEKLSAGALDKVRDQFTKWEKAQSDLAEMLAEDPLETAWQKLTTTGTCALAACVRKSDPDANPCAIAAGGGYAGLENQLYRVEIHEGSEPRGAPSFKWSRDNGSVAFPFEIASANDKQTRIRLPASNPGSYYPVSREEWLGVWVEAQNDALEIAGRSGPLLQISDIPSDAEMVLDGTLSAAEWSDKTGHPLIRRWDQRDAATSSGAVALLEDQWLELEAGVRIRFEKGGTYRCGDYWLIPARTDTADVEWPQNAGEPVYLPPRGIVRRFARLAVFTARETAKDKTTLTEFHDCRRIFTPQARRALHVVGINWANDSRLPADDRRFLTLALAGLQITLDDAPDAWTVNSTSVRVALEYPNGLALTLPGNPQARGNVIVWRPAGQTKKSAAAFPTHMTVLPDLAGVIALGEGDCRLRITLAGHLIWRTCGQNRIYLDGRAFGSPRRETDAEGNSRIRCDLAFPSGADDPGSVFESWLDVIPAAAGSTPGRSATRAAKTKPAASGTAGGK